ncbi:MAG: MFS transporter [Candidatus Limnocylindrales bacterium]
MPGLASPAYRLLLGGAFVANIGSWMQTTAQGWLVLRLTDSAAALGVASFAGMAPTLLLSLYAGVLADRVDRRRLLLGVQATVGVLALILAIITTAGVVVFWQIVLIAFLAGCAQALGIPAFQALVPMLVDRPAVGNAIAVNSAQFNLSRIIGPALAGLFVGTLGEAPSFWLNALAALVLVLVLRAIDVPSNALMSRAEAGLWSNLLDGLRYVRGQRVLTALMALAAAPAFFILPYMALLPIFARDILAIGAPGLGLLTGSIGIGALSGAVVVALRGAAGGDGRVLVIGLTSMAIATAAFALSGLVWLSCLALAALGAAQVAYYTSTNTLVQILAPARLRGRILSIYTLTALGFLPLGSLVAGAVAARVGAPATLAGGAAVTVGALILIVAWCPPIRTLHLDPLVPASGQRVEPLKPSPSELPQEG